MATSTLNFIKERARQNANDDADFLRRVLYYFELRFPAKVSFTGFSDRFIYPLVIPPSNYSVEEPFAVEASYTQGGGLYVEENGIVQRIIRLRGHTGFKPRILNNIGPPSPVNLPPEKKSHSRELSNFAPGALSGQRHFQYLNDSIFRLYGDLKRDPATASQTSLLFHNPRDREHWLVAPQKFMLERDASKRLLYNYNIELLVLDAGDIGPDIDFSEDKSIFEWIKDGLRTLKKAVDMISGAINDLTALVGEIRLFVDNIVTLIATISEIQDAVQSFIDGLSDLIELPYTLLQDTIEAVDEAAETLAENAASVPDYAINKMRQVNDGLVQIGQYPENWETPNTAQMRKLRERQEKRRQWSIERKEDALESSSPTTFSQVRDLGTQLTPGDALSADGELTLGSEVVQFKNAREIEISQGDTLTSLAAQYLGDARLWQQIAVLNGLKPPFIDAQANLPLSGGAVAADGDVFPNTLGLGAVILIPTNQKSTLDLPILPVQGVRNEEDTDKKFLGTDFELEAVTGIAGSSRAFYDIPINAVQGSVDAKTISGLDNLSQMIILRLLTEYGTDTLYKRVGIRRIVGTRFAAVDLETVRFHVLEALSKDPRIAQVESLLFEQVAGQEDQLQIDARVQIRGFAQARSVAVQI